MLIGISGFAGVGKDALGNFLVTDHGFTKVAMADPLKRIVRDVYDFTDDQLWGPSHFRNAPDKRYPRFCKACSGRGDKIRDAHGSEAAFEPCVSCQGERLTYLTPREALQKLGSEWGRDCYPNTWVDLCLRTAQKLLSNHSARYDQKQGLIILDDTRNWATANQIEMTRVRGVAIPDVRFKNEINAVKESGGRVIRIVRPGAGLDGAGALHISEAEQASIPDSEFDFVIQNTGTLEDLRDKVREVLHAP